MTTERPDTEVDIIPDENEMSGINVQTLVDQQVMSLREVAHVLSNDMLQIKSGYVD